MNARIVAGEVAPPWTDFRAAQRVTNRDSDVRPNAIPIAFGADKSQLQKIATIPSPVLEQHRQIIHCDDEDIEVTVVVIIGKGRPAVRKSVWSALLPDRCSLH